MSYNPSLAELLAHSPNAAITERINTLISAREFVLRHRHNAKPLVNWDGFKNVVGIYDVSLSMTEKGNVSKKRGTPKPQLIGSVCVAQDDIELEYAERAWISAAIHLSKLNNGR
jgi:hypothetical protein